MFKKPRTLSNKVQFMFGVGTEWVRSRTGGVMMNSVAGEPVLTSCSGQPSSADSGWHLEPGYEYSFALGHEKSVGISFGL